MSLILAPLVAASGGFVPMLSGRGLGHTGGTLEKLESIPGYRAEVDLDRLRRVVLEVGCAIVGPTAELAPADRRLYAMRDVTATVESIPLITASILSKKLAAGLRVLAMDLKVGSGAFLPELDAARDLARSVVEVAEGAGLACRALLTDMSRCLGRTAGDALEIAEAISVLRGEPADPALLEVTLALRSELLLVGRLASNALEAHGLLVEALSSGRAAERFARMVAALDGPFDLVERPRDPLPVAPLREPIAPGRAGTVRAIDARAVGLAVVRLGGGRTRPGASIDPSVGLSAVAAPGRARRRGSTALYRARPPNRGRRVRSSGHPRRLRDRRRRGDPPAGRARAVSRWSGRLDVGVAGAVKADDAGRAERPAFCCQPKGSYDGQALRALRQGRADRQQCQPREQPHQAQVPAEPPEPPALQRGAP